MRLARVLCSPFSGFCGSLMVVMSSESFFGSNFDRQSCVGKRGTLFELLQRHHPTRSHFRNFRPQSRGGTTWNFYLEDDFESLNQNGHLGFKKPLKLKPLKGKRKKNSPFNIPKATILSHEWCTQTIVSFSASMFPTGSWTILMRKGRGRRSQNGRSRQNSSALHPPPPVPAILIPSDI